MVIFYFSKLKRQATMIVYLYLKMYFPRTFSSKSSLVPILQVEGDDNLSESDINWITTIFQEINIELDEENPLQFRINFDDLDNQQIRNPPMRISYISPLIVSPLGITLSKRKWFQLNVEETLEVSVSIQKMSKIIVKSLFDQDLELERYI